MKKIITSLFLLTFVCFALVACEEPAPTHEHTFSSEWACDETYHWRAATCEHTDEIREKEEHDWDDGVVTKEATIEAEGQMTYTCEVCNYTKNEPIAKLEDTHEHTFQSKWTVDADYHWHAASCSHKDQFKDKGEHEWDEGVVTKEPTTSTYGEKTYTCEVCGHTKKEDIDRVEEEGYRRIEVDYANGILYVPSERELKVAQFADAHFGDDTRNWHNDKIDRTKEYMAYVVEESNPDFIVCSGDNVIGTGITNNAAKIHDLTEFVEFMEGFKIPWTFMYGNHDAETQSKKAYSEFFLDCIATGKTKYLIYKEDYVEVVNPSISTSDEGRYGNFVLPVYDLDDKDNLLGAYIFFDAGTYLYDKSKYQTITEGQVEWYEQQVNALDALYEGEGTVPTVVFTHIQLPEHEIAYHEAYYNQTAGYEFVIRQDEMASDFENVSSQDPSTDSGLFDKMVELGSTKAVFVGHAHEYYFQVKSHGIILGYGPQCGFSKLFELNDEPRLTYVYNFDSSFDFTTTGVKEEENLGSGLVVKYFDGTNGDSRPAVTLDSNTGLYSARFSFYKAWARIKLYVDNELVTVNSEKYNVTGDWQALCDASSFTVYPGSDGATLLYPNSISVYCTVTYNPQTKEININVEEPEVPEGTLLVNKVNQDALGDAVAVWTTAGTELKSVTNASTGATSYIGNGWRTYIVVDSEGRIAYLVANPPNGYGGPSGSGYYCNSYYSDYTANPSFKILDGYGPWVNGGFAHNLYEVVVPAGGFAITSHGSGTDALFDLFGVVMPDFSNEAEPDKAYHNYVNSRTFLSDDIRLSYDASTNTIVVSSAK